MISFAVAGVHQDVFLIWKEMEEAKSTLIQVQKVLAETDHPVSQNGIISVSI